MSRLWTPKLLRVFLNAASLTVVVLALAWTMEAGGQETPGGPPPDSSSEAPPPPTIGANVPPLGDHHPSGTGDSLLDVMHTWDVRTNPTTLVGCTFDGSDIYFRSIGNMTIPAGTVIHWGVAGTANYGTFVLANDLEPGQSVSLAALSGPAAEVSAACLSKIGG